MKRIISILVLAALTITSCGTINAANLSDGIIPNGNIKNADVTEAGEVIADFGVRLLRESIDEKNTLISPLSVLSALAMTASGADGDTLTQMEAVLGMDIESLNAYIKAYTDALASGEKYKLSLANSIWFTDDTRFTVNDDFLQTNADYYGADIYKAPLDRSTRDDINNWVKDRTDGMIPKIIDEIP